MIGKINEKSFEEKNYQLNNFYFGEENNNKQDIKYHSFSDNLLNYKENSEDLQLIIRNLVEKVNSQNEEIRFLKRNSNLSTENNFNNL